MSAYFVTSSDYLLKIIGILFRPELHHEKGCFYVIKIKRVENFVGIIRSPGAIEGNRKRAVVATDAVNGQFPLCGASRVNGVTSARKKDYRRYDYRQKPRDNGYRILFLFFHSTLLDYNIPL